MKRRHDLVTASDIKSGRAFYPRRSPKRHVRARAKEIQDALQTPASDTRKVLSALEETAALLRSPANAKRLLTAVAQLKAGKGTERELAP